MSFKLLLRAFSVSALLVGLVNADVVQSPSTKLNVEHLAKLDNPWGMEFLPQGGLLITEKPGTLRVFHQGKLSDPILGVPDVAYKAQGGLLDVTIDPNFAENHLVYLYYTEAAQPQPAGAKDGPEPRLGPNFKADDNILKGGAVARGVLANGKLSDVSVIWRQTPKTIGRGHFGGRLLFAPDGKYLFITSGERQRFEPAQDRGSNLGKIIRIKPDGSIPDDNPFVNEPHHSTDLYTLGNRNPLGIAIQPETNKIWINEMGPKGGDELQIVEPGKNYGWPIVCEGVHYNDAPIPHHDSHPEFAPPAKAWTPVISPSGMAFYSGKMIPAWKGAALIGGLSSKALVVVKFEASKAQEAERVDMKLRVRDVIESPDGAILILSDGKQGELLRLTPAQ